MRAALVLLLCLAPALHAAEEARSRWHDDWPRFRTSEYALTGLAVAGSAVNFYLVPPPRSAAWRGEVAFDARARHAMMLRSQADRDKAKDLSDLLTFALLGYSWLDGPISAGWAGDDKDTALQLALINAETFAVTEVLNLTVSNALPRRRPEGATCDPTTKYDPHCVKSFWSGHGANVFAAASLVCAQHSALDLYGGSADAVACWGSLGVASVVGALRITSNDHHASDVVVGAAVGVATGYWMPKLLHFKAGGSAGRLGRLIPSVGPTGGGLVYVRTW